MRSSVVSPLRERTSNSSVPRSLIVPAKTVSPGFFSTGMLSPVMGAWLTAEAPETTTPSSAMRSPGRTRTRAPSGTVSALTSSQRPSACFTSAVSGARSISLRIALRARSRLSASIISAMPNSQITTAASGHWPISAAPMTATVISRFMLSDRVRSAIQPFFSVSIPPRAMAASEAPHHRQRRFAHAGERHHFGTDRQHTCGRHAQPLALRDAAAELARHCRRGLAAVPQHGRHAQALDRGRDRRLVVQRMADGQRAAHQVELQLRDAGQALQGLAQQRLLGGAVHLLDQVGGLSLGARPGLAFDGGLHTDLAQRIEHGCGVAQAVLHRQPAVHHVEVESVDRVELAQALADQRFLCRAVHVRDQELRGVAARRRHQRERWCGLAAGAAIGVPIGGSRVVPPPSCCSGVPACRSRATAAGSARRTARCARPTAGALAGRIPAS